MKVNFPTILKQLKRINFYSSSSSIIILGIFAILLSSATVVYATRYNNGQYYQLGSSSYESIDDTTNPRDHYVCNDGSLQRSYLIPNNTDAEWNAFKSATAGLSDLDTCNPIGSCNTDCTPSSSTGCPSGCESSGSYQCLSGSAVLCSGPPYYSRQSVADNNCGCYDSGGGVIVCDGCPNSGESCFWEQNWTGNTCTGCCW